MKRLIRKIRRRQQHMAYLAIGLMLFALAEALGQSYGMVAVLALWVVLVVILEFLYRGLVSVKARNSRKWWAKSRHLPSGFRLCAYLAWMAVWILIRSPFTRYAVLTLCAAGLICAGVIRLIRREDEIPTVFSSPRSSDDLMSRFPD